MHPLGQLESKQVSVGEDVGRSEPSSTACWWGCEMENSLPVPPTIKRSVTMGPSSSTPRYVLKTSEKYVHIKTCAQIFIASFIIAKLGSSLSDHLLTNEWTKCGVATEWVIQP